MSHVRITTVQTLCCLATLAALPDAWEEPQASAVQPLVHPILDDAYYDRKPDMNMGHWIEQNIRISRERFQPFDEIIAKIRAGKFRTHTALETTYNRSSSWARKLRDLVVLQGVMTHAEWRSFFAGRLHRRQNKAQPV